MNMSVNGVNGAKEQPWYCGWLIPCKNESKEVDAISGAAPAKGSRPAKKVAQAKPKTPSLPVLIASCAPNEGDYETCEDQALNATRDSQTGNVYVYSISDCEGPITGAVVYADFDNDGIWEVVAQDIEENGEVTINVSNSLREQSTAYVVRKEIKEPVTNATWKNIKEKVLLKDLWKEAEETTTIKTQTQCEIQNNAPVSGSLKILGGGETGNPMVGELVFVTIEGAQACDTSKNLEYTFYFDGTITVKTDGNGEITNQAEIPEGFLVSANAKGDITIAHAFATAGYKDISVQIYDPDTKGMTSHYTNLTITPLAANQTEQVTPPQASIVGPFVATVGEPAMFMSSDSKEDIYTYDWDYGDGNSAQGAAPEGKVYQKTGTYTVMLTVARIDDPSIKSTVTQTITIIPVAEESIPTPQASITAPFSAEINTPVDIHAGTVDEDNFTYEWSYGDSTSAQGASPEAKIYTEPGTYTIQLTVTSIVDPNKQDVTTQKITIVPTVEEILTPQASIAAPFSASTNAPVDIHAGTVDEDNFTYEWDFGDGTPIVNGAIPEPKTYTQTGTYTIILSVKSKADPTQVSTVSQSITIVNEPKIIVANADVDPNNTAVDGGAQVTINATNTKLYIDNEEQENPTLRYYLHFNDNTTEDNTSGIFSRYFAVNSQPYKLLLVVRDIKDDGTDGEVVDTLPININLWQSPPPQE